MSDGQTAWIGKSNIHRALAAHSVQLMSNSVVVVQIQQLDFQMVNRFTQDLLIKCRLANARLVYVERFTGKTDSLMILHWLCPYDNPRDVESSFFFVDHTPCGMGNAGFTKALQLVVERKPKSVLMVGNFTANLAESPIDSLYAGASTVLQTNRIELAESSAPSLEGWKDAWQDHYRNETAFRRIMLLTYIGGTLVIIISIVIFVLYRRRTRKKWHSETIQKDLSQSG